MKSAFCPVIRNNSPPARRQHIAKVCCFPIGTRLNSRQSRKPRPITRQPVPPTEPEVRCFPFGNRPSAPCRNWKPTARKAESPFLQQNRKSAVSPLETVHPPLARAGNRPLHKAESPTAPYRSRKPTARKAESPFFQQTRKPAPLFGSPTAPYRSRKPAPSSGTRRFPFGSPDKAGKPFGARRDNYFFLCDSLIFRAREAGFRRF